MNQPKKNSQLKKMIFFTCFVFSCIGLTLYGLKKKWSHSPSFSQGYSETIEIGSILPDFILTRLDGSTTSLSSVNAKILMLSFWASWCGTCLIELPTLVRLQQHFAPHLFQVLAINLDENPEITVVPLMKSIFKTKSILQIFQDPDHHLARIFNISAIPATILINHKREVLKIFHGKYHWDADEISLELEKTI